LPAYSASGDTNTGMYFPAADTIAFTEGGVESMRITSAGRVGIGTASPATELQINGTTQSTTRITSDTVTFDLQANETASGYGYLRVTSNHPLLFGTNNAERMRINANGTVGINTTNSVNQLEVVAAGGSTITNGARFASTGNGGAGRGNAITIGASGSFNSVDVAQIIGYQETASATANNASLGFSVADSSGIFTERMRIINTGFVGIGIAAPTCALDVNGGIETTRTTVTSPAATDGNIFSGTYTPTQVSTNTNVDSVTFTLSHYMRVGNVITVGGQITIDATTATTDTTVRMSLPIASNFTSSRTLGGTGSSISTPFGTNNIAFSGDTTNDCAELRLRPSVNTSLIYNYSFTYQVV